MRAMQRLAVLGLLVWAQTAAGCGDSLEVMADGYLRDTASGLYWTRCPTGQGSGECGQIPRVFSWVDALNTARGFKLAEITRWRMPKIDEIEILFARIDATISPACRERTFGAGQRVSITPLTPGLTMSIKESA